MRKPRVSWTANPPLRIPSNPLRMKAIIHTLGQVLYSPSQYVIPVFQRHYRWELPQWQRLWDSLEEIRQPGKTGNHFMGFLVYVVGGTPQPGQNTRFHLIDGQQRLTTLSLLLIAIRNVARRCGDQELAQEIHDDYLVHPRKKDGQHSRLLPKEHDQSAYLALVSGKEPLPGRMAQAVAFFERMLEAVAQAQPDAPRRLFEAACQRLDFMGATLESENAYSIFKSLNSTGVPLSQADLIRNFVFMHVHPDAQEAFDAELWRPLEARFTGDDGRLDEERFARFFRDLLMSEGQYVPPRLTFATFEARHEATGFDPQALAMALAEHADQYLVIASRHTDHDVGVTRALARLNCLDSSTTWPLVLWLFARRRAGALDNAGLARAIDMLCGFILRRFVAGETSRGYGEMFVRAIRDSAGDEPVVALERFLLQRGWPDDARFIEAFIRFPLYKRGYAREVLEALELARGHKEPASLAQAQIEHILPQTLSDEWADALGDEAERIHAEWLHRPGNLTLSAYNQEIGNQPFAVKRARFLQSNIVLTREVAEYAHWSVTAIFERGERLAEEAAALWQGPKEPYAADAGAHEQEARQVRLAFWTGFARHLDASHPELPELEPEAMRWMRLKSGVPQVRLLLRFKVQDGSVALVLRFKRKARPHWQTLHDAPELPNGWVGQAWNFDDGDTSDAHMTLECAAVDKDAAHWPALHDWLASKLALVHAHALPWLRDAMGTGTDDEDDDGEKLLSPTRQRQLAFWKRLVASVAAQSDVVRPQKPAPQHWLNISIGRAGFGIIPTVNQRIGRIGVEVMVAGQTPKEYFKRLLAEKDDIERQLGFALDWMELPDAHQCRIVSWRNDSPLQEEAHWEEYVTWMADRILRIDKVFRPAIKRLP